MLREKIESVVGPMSDTDFKALTVMLDEDIKFNRIGFGKRTNMASVLKLSRISAKLLFKIS